MPDSEILKIIVSVKDQATGAINNITNSLSGLQKAAIAAGSALGALAIKKTIDAFASFDDVLQNSISVMGNVDKAMREKLAQTAIEVGKQLGIMPKEVAEGYYYLASAGLKEQEVLAAIADVATLAKAAHIDMATATDYAVNMMRAFNYEADELNKVTDVMISTVTNSNTNLEQLGEALKYVAPLAAQVGWSFEEVNAVLGLLANRSIKGSQAGTYLRQAIAQLLDPTSEAIDVLERLGLTVEDINPETHSFAEILETLGKAGATTADIMILFGTRAGPAVLGLMQEGVPAIRKFTQELENAGGKTKEVAEIQRQSLAEAIKDIKVQLNALAIEIGEKLAPTVREIGDIVIGFLQDEKTQEQIRTFVEGLKEGLSRIIEALRLVFEILSKLPPGVTKAVGAFAAFGLVIGPILGVISVLSTLWGSISGLTGAVGGLSGILSGLSGVFAAVAGAISFPVVAIGGLIAAIGLLVFNIGGARDKLKSMLSTIKDAFTDAFNKAKAVITNFAYTVFAKAREIGKSIIDGIKSGLSNLWNTLINHLVSPVESAIDWIKDKLKIGSPSRVFEDIGQSIVEGYKRGIATARDLTPKLPLPTIEPPLITTPGVRPLPTATPAGGPITINVDLHGSVIREEADIDRLVTEIERRVARRLR